MPYSFSNTTGLPLINGQPPAIENNWLKPKGINVYKTETKAARINVTGDTASSCTNEPLPITALSAGAVAKIPLVLAELTVEVNLDTVIDFPEPVMGIKTVTNNLKVTQCLLLKNSDQLFIKGLVRKNISYATKYCSSRTGFCENNHHCTVDIPFKLFTSVTFNGMEPQPAANNTAAEFEYLSKGHITGPDFSQISTEFFNESPFCELICSRIVEFDNYINPVRSYYKTPIKEKHFKSLEEKMVMFITINILQNRLIEIPAGNV